MQSDQGRLRRTYKVHITYITSIYLLIIKIRVDLDLPICLRRLHKKGNHILFSYNFVWIYKGTIFSSSLSLKLSLSFMRVALL